MTAPSPPDGGPVLAESVQCPKSGCHAAKGQACLDAIGRNLPFGRAHVARGRLALNVAALQAVALAAARHCIDENIDPREVTFTCCDLHRPDDGGPHA